MSREVITEHIDKAVAAVTALGVDSYRLEMVGAKLSARPGEDCSRCGHANYQEFYEWAHRSNEPLDPIGDEDGECCPNCRDVLLRVAKKGE